jgi:4-amino-4-deoxy-L-arabinose transferase-like glycosyltransferase
MSAMAQTGRESPGQPASQPFASGQALEPHARAIGRGAWVGLTLIVALGLLLRVLYLGRLSLWYDEVVSMRLARSANPLALVHRLWEIDATRAPLHPLLLQVWLRIFGESDCAGRSLSALCGAATVPLVFWLGRQAYGTRTGLWAAWLTAWSPVLVRYSQEVRMYAWLLALTTFAWGMLLTLRERSTWRRHAALGLITAALIYTHPLGLLMAAALALATLINRRAFGLSWRDWVYLQAMAGLAVVPWLPYYFDHPPEYEVGRQPLRSLLGLPIGFIGGNGLTLVVTGALILLGLTARRAPDGTAGRTVWDDPVIASCLLIWLVVPPVVLYVYSAVAHPVFGPARYTLFVAPAYLLLVARGLAKLPLAVALILAGAGAMLSALLLATLVYAPDLKADWRAAARFLDREAPGVRLVVTATDPEHNVEVETARYYLAPERTINPGPIAEHSQSTPVWISVGTDGPREFGTLAGRPATINRALRVVEFPGLRLMEFRGNIVEAF